VITMACRYHEFYGWLLQDAGRYEQAMVATDRARDLATELHDAPLATYLLMRKSNIASDADDPGLALGLAEAAVTTGDGLSPKLRAVAYRQQANAHAAVGDVKDFLAAMNNAFEAVDQDDATGDELAAYCTPSYIAMEAATAWMELGRPDLALQVFEQATTDDRDTFRRDHGLYLARRASACAAVDDIDGACRFGMQALAIANATHSTRTIRQLRRLRAQLIPFQARPPVAALVSGVARLVGSSA
jgi:tetratricopeptide (TPR) repeat protein